MKINQLLVLMKIVRERLGELRQLRSQVATKETFYGQTEKDVEPLYDVIKVDRKITELENFLYLADSAVKDSNAKTEIKLDIKIDILLAPLE